MSTFRCWLHIDIPARTAHLVSLQLGEQGDPISSHTLTYPDVYEIEDFLAHAINETHSDASGMLQAVEIQGADHFWLQLTQDELALLPNLVESFHIKPVPTSGTAWDAEGLAVATPEGLLTLPPHWALPPAPCAQTASQ
jgi:hypothetical protein